MTLPTSTEAIGASVATLPPNHPNGPLAPTSSSTRNKPFSKAEHELDHEKDVETALDTETPMPILQPSISKTVELPNSHDVPRKMSRWHLVLVAALVTFTLCMSSAGAMTLFIALPTIQDDLEMNEHDLQWVAAAYSLTNGCFLLLAGRLADVHGRKLLFLVSQTVIDLDSTPSSRPSSLPLSSGLGNTDCMN